MVVVETVCRRWLCCHHHRLVRWNMVRMMCSHGLLVLTKWVERGKGEKWDCRISSGDDDNDERQQLLADHDDYYHLPLINLHLLDCQRYDVDSLKKATFTEFEHAKWPAWNESDKSWVWLVLVECQVVVEEKEKLTFFWWLITANERVAESAANESCWLRIRQWNEEWLHRIEQGGKGKKGLGGDSKKRKKKREMCSHCMFTSL